MKLIAPFQLDKITGAPCIGDRAPLLVFNSALMRLHKRPQAGTAVVGPIAVTSELEARSVSAALTLVHPLLDNGSGLGVGCQALTAMASKHSDPVDVEPTAI
jgi:hypothetical protein